MAPRTRRSAAIEAQSLIKNGIFASALRSIHQSHPPHDVNRPSLVFDDNRPWQMARWERFSLDCILSNLKPSTSIEIGTYYGGSLAILARHSERVFAIDCDTDVPSRLNLHEYNNVSIINSASPSALKNLLTQDNLLPDGPDFILIDGDHSKKGVQADLSCLVSYVPQKPLLVLLHDSFNPECRNGILESPLEENKHLLYCDVDFVPGSYHHDGFDQAEPGSMWGGFACLIFDSGVRSGPLEIRQSQRYMYEAILYASLNNMK